MLHTSLKLNNEILRNLAQNHNRGFTLEELAKTVYPYSDLINRNNDPIALERENEAKVLEALLFLADHALIFLDPLTDQSFIR